MKKLLQIATCLALLATPAVAQGGGLLYQTHSPAQHPPTGLVAPVTPVNPLPVGAGLCVALGYQQITSLSAASGLTVPATATIAIIIAETQAIRWRDDGVAPTASVGMPLATGSPMVYRGTLSALQFIEQTASAKLDVSYCQ